MYPLEKGLDMKNLVIHSNGQLSIIEDGGLGAISIEFKRTTSKTIPLPSNVLTLDELETSILGTTVVVKKDGIEIARAEFDAT